jgi:putative ABC transport system permease protein
MNSTLAWMESAFVVGILYAPVTLGLAFSFRVLNYPDLTCEGSFLVGSAVSVVLIEAGVRPLAALVLAALAGGIAGAVTGIVHLKGGVTRLLSGFVTTAFAYSITIRLLGGRANLRSLKDTLFDTLNPRNSAWRECAILVIICLGLCVSLSLFYKTRFARVLRALGDTPWFCVSLGKNPNLYLVIGLAIANSLVGFGGGLVSQYKRICDVNMSFGILVSGLAALVLGETLFASRSTTTHVVMCFVGTWVYNLAVGLFYFGQLGDKLLPSDVRFVTGILLLIPSLVLSRKLSRYRLFNSEW